MAIAESAFLFGLYTASLLAIGAVGFTLQFGVTNVLNLAFGSVLTSAIFADRLVGQGSSALLLAVVVGAVWGALFSWIIGRLIVQTYVNRGTSLFGMAMVTIALSLIIQYTLEGFQGPTILSFNVAQNRQFHIGSVVMSDQQLIIIGSAIAVMLCVHFLLRYTRLGLAMRATAADADLSRSCGVSTERVRAAAWLVSGALCGICGVFLGISTGSFDSSIGGRLFITIVAAAIIGGIGKPYGAMVGALIVGMTSEAAAVVLSPAYKDVVAWAILIAVLAFRPQGIFAEFASERELVR